MKVTGVNVFLSPLLLAVSAMAATAQPAPFGAPCDITPEGASKELADCYDDACEAFQAAWDACSTAACRLAARMQYGLDLGSCHQEMAPPPFESARSSWITLWYAGGVWSYSFDGSAPPQSVVYRF